MGPMRSALTWLCVGAALSGGAQGVRAEILDPNLDDPAILHMGPGAGTTCATGAAGNCALYQGSEVVGYSGSKLDIYDNANTSNTSENKTLNKPLLLILAVPNTTQQNLFGTAPSSPIVQVTYYNPYDPNNLTPTNSSTPGGVLDTGTGSYGIRAPTNAAGGYYGSYDTNSTGFGGLHNKDVYSYLGLQADSASMNFTNLSGAEHAINPDITATSFGIYVFKLTDYQLGPKGLVNVTFTSQAIPRGTFAMAYGVAGNVNLDTGNCSDNNGCTVFDTPFTQAGIRTPEPGAFALVLAGLGAFASAARRRSGSTIAGSGAAA